MRPLAILPACVAVLFVLLAAYFELVLDVRAPRSALTQLTALGASASLSFDAQNQKVAQMRALYGEGVQVFLETSTGKQTVMLDGKWRVCSTASGESRKITEWVKDHSYFARRYSPCSRAASA
jgi:hypothetical protein